MRRSAVIRTVRRTIKARRTAVPPARHADGHGGPFARLLLAKLDGASRRLEQSRRPMRRR